MDFATQAISVLLDLKSLTPPMASLEISVQKEATVKLDQEL